MTMPVIKSSPTVLYDYVNLNSVKMLDDICEDDTNKVPFLLTNHRPRHLSLFSQLLWRWGIYVPAGWSTPSLVPIISQTLHYGVQHIMAKAWIQHPTSPPDLRWHHVTKTWNKFLICCMSAQRNYHLSSANTQNVGYVNDILFVGMEDGQPTDSHPSDIETIIDFLRRPHEVLKTLSTSPCTTLIVPFDHVLENCLSITNDAWINNTSNVCLITCHQKSFDHPFQKIHTRTAAYLPCGWSTAHAVPIPLKTETAPRGECAQPKDIALFALDKWIKPPISPDGLYWDRTTKQHRDFILHYMTAHTTTLASASTSDTTELIADVLLLKVKDGHVIDIENNDMIDIEHLVRQTV